MPNTRVHHRSPPIIEIGSGEITPELKNRVIDLEIKKEEKNLEHEYEDNWNCCCFKNKRTDSRMVKYLFQMSIIIAIITICLVKLAKHDLPCEQTNVYVGILTLLIGIVLPSPNASKK